MAMRMVVILTGAGGSLYLLTARGVATFTVITAGKGRGGGARRAVGAGAVQGGASICVFRWLGMSIRMARVVLGMGMAVGSEGGRTAGGATVPPQGQGGTCRVGEHTRGWRAKIERGITRATLTLAVGGGRRNRGHSLE